MYIVADIGGTKTRVAGSRTLDRFDDPIVFDTPLSFEEGTNALFKAAERIAAGRSIQSIAVGVTGVLSRDKRSVSKSPYHHPDWTDRALAELIEDALGAPAYLENDVAMVGLGEAYFGAGDRDGIIVYVTVSTGVNGVRIVNGVVDPSANGFEIGGQYIDMQTPLSLEMLVSGTAVQYRYGVPPKELGKDSPVWEELAEILAYGVHNTILHWSPDRVVLGGSMFNDIGISVERVAHHTKRIMEKFPLVPDIAHARLGDYGGLFGGLARIRQSLEE